MYCHCNMRQAAGGQLVGSCIVTALMLAVESSGG